MRDVEQQQQKNQGGGLEGNVPVCHQKTSSNNSVI